MKLSVEKNDEYTLAVETWEACVAAEQMPEEEVPWRTGSQRSLKLVTVPRVFTHTFWQLNVAFLGMERFFPATEW